MLGFLQLKKNQPYSQYDLWLTRSYLLRGLGFLYLCAFVPMLFQYQALLGEEGLLPIDLYLNHIRTYLGPDLASLMWNRPTLFWLNTSDTFALMLFSLGTLGAFLVLMGVANAWLMFFLWLVQISLDHVGQTFWSFGWESNLLELGFLGIFLCPFWRLSAFSKKHVPSYLIMFLYRLVLFRLMLGAGLIKIRGDACWTELTCLNVHFETQPIPNPLSPYFHFLPEWFLKLSVFFNHFVELVVPFFIFGPRTLRHIAGVIFVVFQLQIMAGGNYAWINHLTLVMIIPCFDDGFLAKMTPSFWLKSYNKIKGFQSFFVTRRVFNVVLTAWILYLNYLPMKNLWGPRQVMNRSYDQFHLVNSYGVFGSVTKRRTEIIIEGTQDKTVGPNTQWKAYEIPCKPGDLEQRPCVISPYHYRITWQIWFAAMGSLQRNRWLYDFVYKLLQNDPLILRLVEKNPFPLDPPRYIRIRHFLYKFKNPYKGSDSFWYERKELRPYMKPLSLGDLRAMPYIRRR